MTFFNLNSSHLVADSNFVTGVMLILIELGYDEAWFENYFNLKRSDQTLVYLLFDWFESSLIFNKLIILSRAEEKEPSLSQAFFLFCGWGGGGGSIG